LPDVLRPSLRASETNDIEVGDAERARFHKVDPVLGHETGIECQIVQSNLGWSLI